MSPVEAILVWITIGFYAVISALYLYGFVFRNEKVVDRLPLFTAGALVVHTAAIVARYLAIGSLPVAGDYESGLAGSWTCVVFTLYVVVRHRKLRGIGVGTLPVSLLLLGYGTMRSTELAPMAASLKSFWLWVHVLFAWLAFGAYVVAFALAIIYLLKERDPSGEFYRRFPDFPILDDLMFKYLIFGFITDAVMIASGAIWAKNLWGNYWSWDPVETWSLITWLIYGVAVHLRVTLGWRGRRLAWILIFALSGMIITYFGITLFVKSSVHFFGAPLGK